MTFNEWLDADNLTGHNPYELNSAAYWAWEGWQAGSLAEREETNRRANASWSLMCEKMVAIEREECAKLCEGEAKRHKESSMYEEDADYKMRFLVYAKHIETCAAAIRARGK